MDSSTSAANSVQKLSLKWKQMFKREFSCYENTGNLKKHFKENKELKEAVDEDLKLQRRYWVKLQKQTEPINNQEALRKQIQKLKDNLKIATKNTTKTQNSKGSERRKIEEKY